MKSFADIAATKIDDVEAPPLPPVGDYIWRITKVPSTRKSNDEKWEFLSIPCKVVEPLDNVDATDYKGDVGNIVMNKQFIFNLEDEAEFDKTLYNVTRFFQDHVKCTEPGMSVAQMINASVNGQFIGAVVWSQDKRDESGETMQANIGRTAPVE